MSISQSELDERVAILRRFRSLLEQQREKFREYLHVLELQESDVLSDKADAVVAHAELSGHIVKGISSLQKIIVPMQKLYEKSGAPLGNTEDDASVLKLQTDLNDLRERVLAQNEKNKVLVKNYMLTIRTEIESLKNPYRTSKSIYAGQESDGNLVHIEA